MDDGDANRLPVFVSVSEIEFPVSERSPRRVITVYNPYGYPIQYKGAWLDHFIFALLGLLHFFYFYTVVLYRSKFFHVRNIPRIKFQMDAGIRIRLNENWRVSLKNFISTWQAEIAREVLFFLDLL